MAPVPQEPIFVTICNDLAENRLYSVIFHGTGWDRGNYLIHLHIYNKTEYN